MPGRITFRDFVPDDITPTLALGRRYETLATVVERVNAWIAADAIDVINLETLLLPGGPARGGETALQVVLDVGPLAVTQWFQAVRVWYRA